MRRNNQSLPTKKRTYDRVIRVSTKNQVNILKQYYHDNPDEVPSFGITNLNVGSNYKWWENWVQFHTGRLCVTIQVKWWLLVLIMDFLVFITGMSLMYMLTR